MTPARIPILGGASGTIPPDLARTVHRFSGTSSTKCNAHDGGQRRTAEQKPWQERAELTTVAVELSQSNAGQGTYEAYQWVHEIGVDYTWTAKDQNGEQYPDTELHRDRYNYFSVRPSRSRRFPSPASVSVTRQLYLTVGVRDHGVCR